LGEEVAATELKRDQYHLIAAKEQTRWSHRARRREERRTTGRILNMSRPKNNGDIRQVEKNDCHKAQPRADDDEQLQDDEKLLRAPQNHAGGAGRHRARAAIVRGTMEAKMAMKRKVKCEFGRGSV
jgi:hypothetical protein